MKSRDSVLNFIPGRNRPKNKILKKSMSSLIIFFTALIIHSHPINVIKMRRRRPAGYARIGRERKVV